MADAMAYNKDAPNEVVSIMKGVIVVATATFDKRISFTDEESVKKFEAFLLDEAPKKFAKCDPYSDEEQKRSESLLLRCLSRSGS